MQHTHKKTTFQTFSFQNKITRTATFAFVSHLFPKPPHPNQAIKPSTQHTHTHARARAHTHTHTHTHSHRFISWPHQLSISVLFIYSQDLNKTQQTAGGSHTQGQSQYHLTEHRVERESQTWWPQACKINRERSPPDRKQNQVQNRDSCVPETNHNGSLL